VSGRHWLSLKSPQNTGFDRCPIDYTTVDADEVVSAALYGLECFISDVPSGDEFPNLPTCVFLSPNHKHQTIEKISAIQNLLYLIRVDAYDPAPVTSYANRAERLLLEMQMQILPES